MLTPERVLALLDKLRVEWAMDGVRNPNKDWTPDFAYGVVHGRDVAIHLLRDAIVTLIAAEEEDKDGVKR